MKTIEELLVIGKAALEPMDVKHSNPVLEAQLLLAHVLGCERVTLYTWPQRAVSEENEATYLALLERRQQHEPIAYILGHKEFWSLHFEVNEFTLVPRYETELLVETVLAQLPESPQMVLDMGTGCGAIACALASSRPQWQIMATDISAGALEIAQKNANNLDLASRISFMQSDWFSAIPNQKFDAIVSNPPYIREYDLHLMHKDLLFEPKNALTPGPSGLEAYKIILAQCKNYLKPKGLLAFEHGFDQGQALQNLLIEAGFTEVTTYHDLAALERVTIGRNS